ncbi:hypothetical protein AJ78_00861 [Emergomyces pasteurianus Ep9510]|uniref:Uncharacterized protein n=1 Tax=Emergomyces pasteurianus Ep9510 TaxID=1447872 RepID=A0A1J9PRW8_9EURO|nr:hypothetical protein AJ78_00861 [Emergomyces pasteurianus Ep9510]
MTREATVSKSASGYSANASIVIRFQDLLLRPPAGNGERDIVLDRDDLQGFDGPGDVCTRYMVKLDIDVGRHRRENAYAYEVDNLDYDLMLGISWLAEQNILLDARNRTLSFLNEDCIHENNVYSTMKLKQISANAYKLL